MLWIPNLNENIGPIWPKLNENIDHLFQLLNLNFSCSTLYWKSTQGEEEQKEETRMLQPGTPVVVVAVVGGDVGRRHLLNLSSSWKLSWAFGEKVALSLKISFFSLSLSLSQNLFLSLKISFSLSKSLSLSLCHSFPPSLSLFHDPFLYLSL